MGSPVSVVGAEIVMQNIEEQALATYSETIPLWLRSVKFPFNLPVSLISIAPKPVYSNSETTRLHRMYCFSRLSTRKSAKKWPRVLQSVKLCPPSSEPCKCDRKNEEEGLGP